MQKLTMALGSANHCPIRVCDHHAECDGCLEVAFAYLAAIRVPIFSPWTARCMLPAFR